MRSIRIIHIPAHQDPYQRSLLGNLKKLGCDVRYGILKQYFSVIEISLLFNVIRNFKVDIIHLHWQHPFLLGKSKFGTIVKSLLFIIQLVVIKIIGVKFIWTVHNLKNHENCHKELELFFTGKIAGYADKIIAHCEASKRDVIRKFNVPEHKIEVISHGGFVDTFPNSISRKEARNRLNLSSTDLTFLFLGLIRQYKGVLELIESFRKLDSSCAKLIIAGKPKTEQLIKLIRSKAEGDDNIRLIFRPIPDDEVQTYMNAADITIFPYRDILNSGSVVLGMSFGKAIITPYLGCIPEVLNGSGSFLYDPGEQDGLLNAMKQAMDAKARLLEMGNYNLSLAKKLDWRDIAASTYRVYRSCLGR